MRPTRRGKGTKWLVVVDGQGLAVGKQLGSASPHESRFIETAVQERVASPVATCAIYDKVADDNAPRARMAELGICRVTPELRSRRTHVQDKR